MLWLPVPLFRDLIAIEATALTEALSMYAKWRLIAYFSLVRTRNFQDAEQQTSNKSNSE